MNTFQNLRHSEADEYFRLFLEIGRTHKKKGRSKLNFGCTKKNKGRFFIKPKVVENYMLDILLQILMVLS